MNSEYLVFHREWYELRKDMSAKVWYELETYILQLRFDGIDTDPQTIKNKNVKRNWILIRKKILDSIEKLKRKNKAKTKDLSISNDTNDKSITPIVNNAINSPETPNNDELTEEQQKKVEDIYNSYSFQTRVLSQIGVKDREDIESDFINIMKHHNVYDYYSPIYKELERRFLNLFNN